MNRQSVKIRDQPAPVAPPAAQPRRSTSKPHLQRRGNREGSGVRESKDGRVKGIKAMGKHEKFIKPFLSRRGTSVSDLFAFQRSALASRGFRPGVRSSWRTMPRPRVQSSHPATPQPPTLPSLEPYPRSSTSNIILFLPGSGPGTSHDLATSE